MKRLYIIVSAAAYKQNSEKETWSALKAEGFQVRDIHDLPRIGQHEIALANVAIARLVKRRLEFTEKQVKLICLIKPKEVLANQLSDYSEKQVENVYSEIHLFALCDADYCVPYDEPMVATKLIMQIIENEENKTS